MSMRSRGMRDTRGPQRENKDRPMRIRRHEATVDLNLNAAVAMETHPGLHVNLYGTGRRPAPAGRITLILLRVFCEIEPTQSGLDEVVKVKTIGQVPTISGGDLHLSCIVEGSEPIQIQWF
ncbi:unnamed protein product, partial [Nesidiocoris tenuis]